MFRVSGKKVYRITSGKARQYLGKAFWSETVAREELGRLRRGEIDQIVTKSWGTFMLKDPRTGEVDADTNEAEPKETDDED